MHPALNDYRDVLALVAALWQFSAVFSFSVRMWMLRRQQTGCKRLGWSGLLVLLAAAWLTLNFFDLGSLLNTVGNAFQDVPLATSIRAFLLGTWVWVGYMIVPRLAKEQLR